MSEDSLKKLVEEKEQALKAAEAKFESAKEKYEDVRVKYNQLIGQFNELQSNLEKKSNELDSIKNHNKNHSSKLLVQVADVQKEKTELAKTLEAKEKEIENLKIEVADYEKFTQAVREDIIAFRDAKNGEIAKLQKELTDLKQHGTNGPSSNADQSAEIELLKSENKKLQNELEELRKVVKSDQLAVREDGEECILRAKLEVLDDQLSTIEEQRSKLRWQKEEIERKLNGATDEDSASESQETQKKNSLTKLLDGSYKRQRKLSVTAIDEGSSN